MTNQEFNQVLKARISRALNATAPSDLWGSYKVGDGLFFTMHDMTQGHYRGTSVKGIEVKVQGTYNTVKSVTYKFAASKFEDPNEVDIAAFVKKIEVRLETVKDAIVSEAKARDDKNRVNAENSAKSAELSAKLKALGVPFTYVTTEHGQSSVKITDVEALIALLEAKAL